MSVLILPFQFGSLLFLFLVWLLWLGLPILCWIEVVKEDILPCLVPNLHGKAISFCPFSMMLAVCLSYMDYILLRNAPSIPTLLSVFYQKWVLYLIKCFFAIYWYDHVIFVFAFVYVVYYVYWFANIVLSLHPWDESHLVMVYDLLNVLLDAVCQYFVENFLLYVHQRYWPEVFFLRCVFVWFWDFDDASFIKSLGVFPLLELFWIICEG